MRKLHAFPGRKPRERDEFNSALNYGYGILYDEVERACFYVGLDPYMGLYHTERYGKPSLVLDLARFSHCSEGIRQTRASSRLPRIQNKFT